VTVSSVKCFTVLNRCDSDWVSIFKLRRIFVYYDVPLLTEGWPGPVDLTIVKVKKLKRLVAKSFQIFVWSLRTGGSPAIVVLLTICQWKKFESRSVCDAVVTKTRRLSFWTTLYSSCILHSRRKKNTWNKIITGVCVKCVGWQRMSAITLLL